MKRPKNISVQNNSFALIGTLLVVACSSTDRDFSPSAGGAAGSAGLGASGGAVGNAGAGGTATGGLDGSAGISGAGNDGSGGNGQAGAGVAGSGGIAGGGPGITGRVQNLEGSSVAGAKVLLNGKDSTTTAEGVFTLPAQPETYDITVVDGTYVAIAYGIKRRDPVFKIDKPGIALKTADVKGTLSGANFPLAANRIVSIGLARATGFTKTASTAYGPTAFKWPSAAEFTNKLFGIQFQYDPSTLLPVDYLSWESKTITLKDGVAQTVDMAFAKSVTERDLKGKITLPADFTSSGAGVLLGGLAINGHASSPPNPYSYKVPNGLDVNVVFTTGGKHTNGATTGVLIVVPDETSTLDVESPMPSSQAAPVNNATGISHDTAFSWSAVPNAVYRITFKPTATGPTFDVVTTQTTTKMPDFASIGFALPKNATYTWKVTAYGPANSVDELFRDISLLDQTGRSFMTESALRSFTTAK
jgi:hypothetical protein